MYTRIKNTPSQMTESCLYIKILSLKWSGREELNFRPPGPEPGTLTRLRYAPTAL